MVQNSVNFGFSTPFMHLKWHRCERLVWSIYSIKYHFSLEGSRVDFSDHDLEEAIGTIRSRGLEGKVLQTIADVLDGLKPKLSKADEKRLIAASEERLEQTFESTPAAFRFLDEEMLDQFLLQRKNPWVSLILLTSK